MLTIDGVPIRRRLGSAYAQARLAEALYEIALEGLDPSLTGPAAHAWLRVALERPITRATDAALDRFCGELELLAPGAPAAVRTPWSCADGSDGSSGAARSGPVLRGGDRAWSASGPTAGVPPMALARR
jgi:hypothetical protein